MSDLIGTPLSRVQFYTLEINEFQRNLLAMTLNLALLRNDLELKAWPGQPIHGGSAFEEIESIVRMLTDMPKVEAEHPGIVHGLCL